MTKEEFINHINKINKYYASKLDTWAFVLTACKGKLNTSIGIVEKNMSRYAGKGVIDAEGIYNSLGKNHLKHLKKFNYHEHYQSQNCS